MAAETEKMLRKLRDDTSTLILNAHLKQQLSAEEMQFLLGLLDLVAKRQDHSLLPLIRTWQENRSENSHDVDAIIKETLLNLDFSNKNSIAESCNILKELLEDNNEHGQ